MKSIKIYCLLFFLLLSVCYGKRMNQKRLKKLVTTTPSTISQITTEDDEEMESTENQADKGQSEAGPRKNTEKLIDANVLKKESPIDVPNQGFIDKTDKEFLDNCIRVSNNYRTVHHTPKIEIVQEAVTYAKTRCQIIAQNKQKENPVAEEYGENRFFSANSENELAPCSEAIEKWYNKSTEYDYNNGKASSFTQLVWKATTQVGCARCYGKEQELFKSVIICDYKPRGNYKGEYLDNVMKP